MNASDFEKKLASLPMEEPDETDRAMLAEAEAVNDGSLVNLDDLAQDLEDYSGKLVLRLPRSLHKALKREAAIEGVSLNQYMIYKLAR